MRAGKLLALLLVLACGGLIEVAYRLRQELDLTATGWRVLGGRFQGRSHTFTSESRIEVPAGLRLEVANAFGEVRVARGEPGAVAVELRKVVYASDEQRARTLAEGVELESELDGARLRVGTSREAFVRREPGVGLETHLTLRAPEGTVVHVRNQHGNVAVADAAAADVEGSYDGVRVERVAGDVRLRNRHGAAYVADVGAALDLESQYGKVELVGIGGDATLAVRHGDVKARGTRALQLELAYGDLVAEQVGGALLVSAQHAGVVARDVTGDARVVTSYRGIELARVGGEAHARTQHGAVRLEGVAGAASASTSYADVSLEDVAGPVAVEVEHGGASARGLRQGGRLDASGDGVTLADCTGALELRSQRGGIRFVAAAPLTSALTATAVHGDVTLELLPAGAFALEASSRRGRVTVALPGFEATHSEPSHVSGRLGSGGPPVRLDAEYGDVRVTAGGER